MRASWRKSLLAAYHSIGNNYTRVFWPDSALEGSIIELKMGSKQEEGEEFAAFTEDPADILWDTLKPC